ncbi:MAG: ClbS/DfsB family four-helix bundle protein [Roseibium sp.]|nr:ClbS/DfsB family four-helix bundle protein [Roseibium sp.]
MPAKSKAELIAVSEKEFAKLAKVLDQIPDPLRLEKDEEGVSPKDIVGHRAHWIALFLGWYRDGLAGREVFFPAKGYKWNDLKRYNADLRAAQADLGWEDARAELIARHAELMALIEAASDGALYGGPMAGARNDWTAGRWAEAAGPSHYRSAAKYLRQRIRQGT